MKGGGTDGRVLQYGGHRPCYLTRSRQQFIGSDKRGRVLTYYIKVNPVNTRDGRMVQWYREGRKQGVCGLMLCSGHMLEAIKNANIAVENTKNKN